MNVYDNFFIFSLTTIIITRILVYLFNKPSPTIKNIRIHHWMFGLLFTILLFCTSSFYTNIYLLSISIGIFLDEIGFIIIKGKTHEYNYSPKSFMILIVLYLFYLYLEKKLLISIYK